MRSWKGSVAVLERLKLAACQERALVDEKSLHECSSFFNPDFSLARDRGSYPKFMPNLGTHSTYI